ncbi:MAG: prepilin-type N-terminal cleavage/methylation domain-containing protein [Parcubacteria group bacterium]|nr:prepilin-type N-terminal cleavage/methylation domain-containing protein [Parcubacteria group bacterium]
MFKYRKSEGFTLVEGLIASGLLVVGMAGVLALINSSLRLAAFAKDELIAANLAQEGVEIVRAIRDENWINDRAFNSGIGVGDFIVHYPETRLLGYQDMPLRFDSNTGFFQYQSGTNTVFKRTITIMGVSDNEFRVTSHVRWESRGIPFSVDVEDHLFNWVPR